MDRIKNKKVILLSIRPEYAKAIFSGEKRVEFRKLNVPDQIEHVVLYVTAPEQKILGYFSVDMVVKACPNELWKKYGKTSGISKEHFLSYYGNRDLGLGILVDEVNVLLNPMRLAESGNGLRPPQSFTYVDKGFWNKIRQGKGTWGTLVKS